MLEVVRGKFKDYIDTIEYMFKDHYMEAGDLPLDFNGINKEYYLELEQKGRLVAVGCRDKETLVPKGYMSAIVYDDPHNKDTLFAYIDSFYVNRECRGTEALKAVKQMFALIEEILKTEVGVKVIQVGSARVHDTSSLLKRLGYIESDIVFSKRI